MAKPSRAIGMIATISFALSSALPQPVHAGNDTQLAKELWAQLQEKGDESRSINAKIADALNRGDVSAVCSYALQAQAIEQYRFDLSLRMSNLDLDPQNAETVQAALAKSRTALQSVNDLVNLPECNPPVEPVQKDQDEKDLGTLNVAVATARKLDSEGRTFFVEERWSVACSYLTVAQLSYANNSRLARDLSASFSTQNDPQPQFAELSDELAGLEKAVTPKRDIACENEKAGG